MAIEVSPNLSVEYMVLCEDIREEVGHKFTLVGVFNGDIMVQSLPAAIRAAFFGAIKCVKAATETLFVKVELNGKVIAEAPTEFVFEKAGTVANFVIPTGIIALNEPAEVRFLVSVDQKNWTSLLHKRIVLPV